ncbi:MAG TPA: hypothetical protein V6C81_16550 [Planktothrix sp.]|jgi:tetratricopeptide (TPR) repeat protein
MNIQRRLIATALLVTANIGVVAGTPVKAAELKGPAASSAQPQSDAEMQKAVYAKCEAGEFDAALVLVEQMIKANPKSAMPYMCKAMIFYYQHDGVAKVMEALNQAIEVDPKSIDALVARGCLYESVNNFGMALKDFDAILAIDPTNLEALQQRTKIHLAFHNKQGLIADYTLAIARNHEDAEAYYRRGIIYELLGEKKKAMTDLQRAEDLFVALKQTDNARAARERLVVLQKTA